MSAEKVSANLPADITKQKMFIMCMQYNKSIVD